jgi:hypothetical protein
MKIIFCIGYDEYVQDWPFVPVSGDEVRLHGLPEDVQDTYGDHFRCGVRCFTEREGVLQDIWIDLEPLPEPAR